MPKKKIEKKVKGSAARKKSGSSFERKRISKTKKITVKKKSERQLKRCLEKHSIDSGVLSTGCGDVKHSDGNKILSIKHYGAINSQTDAGDATLVKVYNQGKLCHFITIDLGSEQLYKKNMSQLYKKVNSLHDVKKHLI